MSLLVNRSNFNLIFLKAACHANPSAEWKQAQWRQYISRHIFRKLLDTSASNYVSLWA